MAKTMIRRAVAYLFLSAALVVAVSPFLVTIIASLKEPIELVRGPFRLPESWRFDNYREAWITGNLDRYFFNSIVVVILVVVPSIFLSAMSGYAFARFRFRGAGFLFGFLLLGLIVPLQAIVIPLFYLLRELGMLNSYWGLVFPQIALSLSFGTLLMRQAFIAVPREIVEASIVDGANSWTTLWRILFPLTRPVVGTLALMIFVWTWNEFLLPLIVSLNPKYQTLPVGILAFQQQWTSNVPVIAAGSTIIFLPLTIVFLVFQQQLVRGITTGAVKG
jgi:raffinose/stachyose/melibiose transport system permease protein